MSTKQQLRPFASDADGRRLAAWLPKGRRGPYSIPSLRRLTLARSPPRVSSPFGLPRTWVTIGPLQRRVHIPQPEAQRLRAQGESPADFALHAGKSAGPTRRKTLQLKLE